jgi:hypothetical protein
MILKLMRLSKVVAAMMMKVVVVMTKVVAVIMMKVVAATVVVMLGVAMAATVTALIISNVVAAMVMMKKWKAAKTVTQTRMTKNMSLLRMAVKSLLVARTSMTANTKCSIWFTFTFRTFKPQLVIFDRQYGYFNVAVALYFISIVQHHGNFLQSLLPSYDTPPQRPNLYTYVTLH